MREELSELEHKQWMKWSKTLAKELEMFRKDLYDARFGDIPLEDERNIIGAIIKCIDYRLERWKQNWKPYNKLDEKTKDFDRIWADKVLTIFYRDFNP